MSRLTNYAAIWIFILTIVFYYAFYTIYGYTHSKFVADWLVMVGFFFMSASTTPVAYRAFKNGIRSDRDKFIFSYWLIWTIIWWQRVWIIFLNYNGFSKEWIESPISGFLTVMLGLAAGYAAVAPFSGGIPLRKKEVFIFSIAAGFSGIIAGIAIGVFFVAGWVN